MANEHKDYYAALGVARNASPDDLKKAFRRLAREHHPDLHSEKNKARAGERFKEINEAYEVLSDPVKRAKYDRAAPGRDRERPAGSPPRRAEPPDFGGAREFSGFSDFIEGLYDRASGGFRTDEGASPRRGRDVEADVLISLEDAVRGGEKRLSVKVPAPCADCAGSGRRGRGLCPTCGGAGEARIERTLAVRLPQAVRDGVRVRLRGQGGSSRSGEAGDLFLRLRLLPHPSFKVSGSDLETTMTVMPWVAALGGEAPVPTLDGPIRIKIPAGTHAGRAFRVAGKGLGKDGGGRGDLHATLRIDIPDRLGPKLERLFSEMRDAGA